MATACKKFTRQAANGLTWDEVYGLFRRKKFKLLVAMIQLN
jgi:hypothetical protein